MTKLIRHLKSLFFPITLLTLITVTVLIGTIQSIYVAIINNAEAAIYVAITIPIALITIVLYSIDRLLIKKISYIKLMLGEIIIGIIILITFLYQNSSIEINFHTDKDDILVIFDSKENSLSKFSNKGVFGKELNVYKTNIVHLDTLLSLRKDLKINTPKQWERFTQYRSKIDVEGDSIEYVFISKKTKNTYFEMHSHAYLDSLLNNEK